MHDLAAWFDVCRKELTALGIPIGDAVVRENKRFRSRWGQCRRSAGEEAYVIEISSVLLEDGNPVSALRDTIFHELLHTCPGCMNHGTAWRRYADMVNRRFGCRIKRTAAGAEYGVHNARKAADPAYQFRCQRCGAVISRYRRCRVVAHPERYVCSKCGGRIVPVNF